MSAPARTAVLVLAISAGAPLLPKKLMRLGREGYVVSLVVTSSLVAIAAVPLWVHLIGALIGRESAVEPWALAALLAKAFLAPLLAGMLLRYPLGAAAEPLSERLLEVAGAILAAAGLGLLALHGRLLGEAGVGPLVALLVMTLVALAIGHLLGGPDPGERTALAVVCATRHVGIALLAAAAVPGPRTAAFVLAYLLASGLVTFVYLRARTRPRARSA
jgi:BASS family bile acid:Na+ symporter